MAMAMMTLSISPDAPKTGNARHESARLGSCGRRWGSSVSSRTRSTLTRSPAAAAYSAGWGRCGLLLIWSDLVLHRLHSLLSVGTLIVEQSFAEPWLHRAKSTQPRLWRERHSLSAASSQASQTGRVFS